VEQLVQLLRSPLARKLPTRS